MCAGDCVPLARVSPPGAADQEVSPRSDCAAGAGHARLPAPLSAPLAVAAAAAAAVASAQHAMPARAEDVPALPPPPGTEDFAMSAILSILATAAFVGLVVLTVGVIYLTYSDWKDKRESEALAKAETAKPKRPTIEDLVPKAGTGKGFGQVAPPKATKNKE